MEVLTRPGRVASVCLAFPPEAPGPPPEAPGPPPEALGAAVTSLLWDNAMMEGPVTLLSRLLESPFTATVTGLRTSQAWQPPLH